MPRKNAECVQPHGKWTGAGDKRGDVVILGIDLGRDHRRRIYKEAKANCRRCFLGGNGHPHAFLID